MTPRKNCLNNKNATGFIRDVNHGFWMYITNIRFKPLYWSTSFAISVAYSNGPRVPYIKNIIVRKAYSQYNNIHAILTKEVLFSLKSHIRTTYFGIAQSKSIVDNAYTKNNPWLKYCWESCLWPQNSFYRWTTYNLHKVVTYTWIIAKQWYLN